MSGPGGNILELEAPPPGGEQQKASELEKIKIDGEAVPEELKGKSAAELVAAYKARGEALKISEDARKSAIPAAPQPLNVTVTAPTPAPQPERPLSLEELKKLHDEDPIAAIAYMSKTATETAEKNFNARMGGLTASAATVAETAARVKYVEEFEVLGAEIKTLIDTQVADKSLLANPKTWDDMMSYVRGQNIEKIFAHRNGKEAAGREAAAKAAQLAAAGASLAPSFGAPVRGAALDETEKHIAMVQFPGLAPEQAFKEYMRWRDM